MKRLFYKTEMAVGLINKETTRRFFLVLIYTCLLDLLKPRAFLIDAWRSWEKFNPASSPAGHVATSVGCSSWSLSYLQSYRDREAYKLPQIRYGHLHQVIQYLQVQMGRVIAALFLQSPVQDWLTSP